MVLRRKRGRRVLGRNGPPGQVKIPGSKQNAHPVRGLLGGKSIVIQRSFVQHLIHALHQIGKQPAVDGALLVRQLLQRLGVRLLCAQQRFVILLQGLPHPGPIRVHGVARNDLIARDLGRHIKVDFGFAHQKILLGKSMLALAHLQLLAVNGVAQRIQAPVAPVQKQLGIPVFVAVLQPKGVAFTAAFPPQIGREHLPDLFRLGVARI